MSQTYQDALANGECVENYQVIRPLGAGSFGITYLAVDQDLNADVAIKEYMPRNFVVRAQESSDLLLRNKDQKAEYEFGLERFLAEAQTLARFRDPHFVSVKRYFRANNTAYIVMDYEHGHSLREFLLTNPKRPSERFLLGIVIPILTALRKLHDKGFLHRDIKPGNIYLRQDKIPVLIDFGAARQAFGELSNSLTEIVTPNYSPFEQYVNEGKQGPTTDIYAIGATLYKCITGVAPVDAITRIAAINEGNLDPLVPAIERGRGGYSEAFLMTVDWMLQPYPKDRPQSAQAVIDDLAAATITGLGEKAHMSLFPKGAAHQIDGQNQGLMLTSQRFDQTTIKKKVKPRGGLSKRFDKESRASIFSGKFAIGCLGAIGFIVLLVYAIANLNESRSLQNSRQRIDPILRKADKAMAEDRILQPAGNNALNHFKAVLEIDSRNQAAINGIDRIVEHFVKQANVAVAQNNIKKANQQLTKLGDVVAAIQHGPHASALLSTAEQETARLRDRIDQVVAARRAEVARRRQKQFNQLMDQAQANLKADRLTFPPGQNAFEQFQKILELDSQHVGAINGLERIVDRYIVLVRAMVSRQNYQKAEEYLESANRVLPGSPKLQAAKDAMLQEKTAIERSKRLKSASRRPELDTPTRKELRKKPSGASEPEKLDSIPPLLKAARVHIAALRLQSPQGNNALETYQQILALDRENADARRGIDRIRKQTGWLRITGLPRDGDLFVDNIKLVHQGDLTIKLFSGFHTVSLKKRDKPIESKLVRIRQGSESQIAFVKLARPEPPQPPKPAKIPQRLPNLPPP